MKLIVQARLTEYFAVRTKRKDVVAGKSILKG